MSSTTNFSKLTVVHLKKELTERSLSTAGLKADLVARLTAYEESKHGVPADGNQSEAKPDAKEEKLVEKSEEQADKPKPKVVDTQANSDIKESDEKKVEDEKPSSKTPAKKLESEKKPEVKQAQVEVEKPKEKKEEKETTKTETVKVDNHKVAKVAPETPSTPPKKDSKEDAMEVDKDSEDKKRKTTIRDSRTPLPGSTAKRQRMWESDPAPASDISINSEVLKDVLIQNKQDDSENRNDRSNGSRSVTSTPQQKEGATREVAPSRKPTSRVLHIRGFVRPFTVKQVEAYLAQEGELESLWMNSVKSEAYATFKTEEQATATRKAITNTIWPVTNPTSRLHADFAREEEAKQAAAASAPRTPKTPAAPARPEVRTPATAEREVRGADLRDSVGLATRTMKEAKRAATEREDERERDRERDLARRQERDRETRDSDRVQGRRDREPPKEKKFVLEDLFRKTSVKPHIYWVALTEAEVQKKLEA